MKITRKFMENNMEERSEEWWANFHHKHEDIEEPLIVAAGLLVSEEKDQCWQCGKDLDYKIQGCCSGRDCGCMGMPVDLPVCSNECEEAWKKDRDKNKNKVKNYISVDLEDDIC